MTRDELLAHLLKSIKEHTQIDVHPQDFGRPLTELGIDSIFAAEIANDFEDLLDIVIDDRQIVKFVSVNAILKYFEEHITE